jgi:hypothetical protein
VPVAYVAASEVLRRVLFFDLLQETVSKNCLAVRIVGILTGVSGAIN